MSDKNKYKIVVVFIALILFINGFFCKILNFVPRHQEIVAKILSEEYAREITFTIGILEILMAIWVLSNYKSKLNAIVQFLVILMMNILEFILVPELLFWGKLNIIFAVIFIAIIFYNEFVIKKKRYV